MTCACGGPHPVQKDGRCKGCRLAAYRAARTKFHWKPEMDERIREVYRAANRLAEFRAALKQLAVELELPRHALTDRAARLGERAVVMERRPWTAYEDSVLDTNAGVVPVWRLAKQLRRATGSIHQRMRRLGLSGFVRDGFSRHELGQRFGVAQKTVREWLRLGWLEEFDGRVPHAAVERFVWERMDEYRLGSCDDAWLKRMLRCWVERQEIEWLIARPEGDPSLLRLASLHKQRTEMGTRASAG